MYNYIVVGAGFAGSVIAGELARRGNKKVLIIEKRNHIGGNSYDFLDENQILIHKYGPHIFHTNHKRVYDYLSQFTDWSDYIHEVIANIHGKLLPVPFNLNSLSMIYDEETAKRLADKLITTYGLNAKVPILTLKENEDKDIQSISDYVYNNIFLHYTTKQWGLKPEDIDPAVTKRVPVLISYDNSYFQDTYQGMPLDGYTQMFQKLLDHPNITISLNTDAKDILSIHNDEVYYNQSQFPGKIIYTGAIDELFNLNFGRLPYRTLQFGFEHHDIDYFQTKGTVNYTVSEDFTRITEFKHLTGQVAQNSTTILKEYPMSYSGKQGETPFYPINNNENDMLYKKYKELAEKTQGLYLLGRLAEYKYYNMDEICDKALELADFLLKEKRCVD